jgi:catechol 2,3-dioxygenase-like lactoylglutathione lyase family enzyme
MQIRQVMETCLYAKDLEINATFYQNVLGLERCSELDGRHVFFRCGEGMVLLFNPAATEQPINSIPTHGAYGPGHVAFSVSADELDNWKDRLENLNITIESEINWPQGGRSIYVRDPANNSVELVTPQTWKF